MMGSLSKEIENYLKQLLAEEEILIIQRSVLSEMFCCVPSQINYVLRTRFTPTDGYIVETRRGGGGYVRIQAIPIEREEDLQPLFEAARQELSEAQEEGIITYLVENNIIPPDVGTLFKSIFKDRVLQSPEPMTANELRAHLVTHLLANLSVINEKEDETKDSQEGN